MRALPINAAGELVFQIQEDDNRSEIRSIEVQKKVQNRELSLLSEDELSEIVDSDDSSFSNPRVRVSSKKPSQE